MMKPTSIKKVPQTSNIPKPNPKPSNNPLIKNQPDEKSSVSKINSKFSTSSGLANKP